LSLDVSAIRIFKAIYFVALSPRYPAEPNSSKAAAAKLHFSVQGRQNLASEVAYSDLGTSTERPVTTITQESTADSSGRLKRQKESWSEELASLKH